MTVFYKRHTLSAKNGKVIKIVEKQLRLGDILIDDGCITETQLKDALDIQKKGNSKRLGALLLDEGIITEIQLLEALSRRLTIPLVDLRRVSVDREAVAMVPKGVAVKYNILPIAKDDGNVTLVVDDPLNFYAIEDVKSFLPMPARLVLASRDAIHQGINRYYAEIDAKKAVNNANIAGIGVREAINVEQDEDAPVISLVNSILVKAYSEGASDIHFEPFEDHMSIRYRVDGMLID